VIAGAGSGKTRVITRRIAFLIQEKEIFPDNILAITFTNKAAGEMRARVRSMLPHLDSQPWISTFHSFCLRILRMHISALDFPVDFVIYDAQDQLSLIKHCMKAASVNTDSFPPKSILHHISGFKNDFLLPKDIDKDALPYGNQLKAAEVYPVYQNELKKNRALDFDDLILWTVRMFQEAPQIHEKYSNKFRHILVDEFQDSNETQYNLVRLIGEKHKNVCVVGDDDQSIYRWRGANLENIMHFEKDFPNATIIKLEENYRSTQNILKAAGCVVDENIKRRPKTLWTGNEPGDPIVYYRGENENDEAMEVADRILKENQESGTSFNEMVVLYRTNAQSRILEEALRKRGIPYQVFGGLKFYARKEVKDILSFLKVILNPEDSISLKRIVNVPPRGIGKSSLDKVEAYCEGNQISLMEGLRLAGEKGIVSSGPARKIAQFIEVMDGLKEVCGETPEPDFLGQVLDKTGYGAMLEKDDSHEGKSRVENIKELYSAVDQHLETGKSLREYLDSITLVADIDSLEDSRGLLPIMTLHTCKGLEFQVVFIIGMEDGLLPHASSMSDNAEYEEERRLCYVGFTRAKKKLMLFNARRRRIYGSNFNYPPSSFLSSIPSEILLKEKSPESTIVTSSAYQDSGSIPQRVVQTASQDDFAVGTKVLHAKFGAGVVINREGQSEGLKVEVFFKKPYGKKKLAVSLAKLIPL